MNCNCISEINEKLKEHNLRLSGYAFTFPEMKVIPYINCEWISRDKAPKGRKRNPTSMHASFCPFCGVEIEAVKQATKP